MDDNFIRVREEVPFYIKKNSGKKLAKRPERLVKKLKRDGLEFGIYADIIKKGGI